MFRKSWVVEGSKPKRDVDEVRGVRGLVREKKEENVYQVVMVVNVKEWSSKFKFVGGDGEV